MESRRDNKKSKIGGQPGKIVSPQDEIKPEGRYKEFKLGDLFEIKKGKRLTKADMIPGNINFIGATDSNNGKTASIANNTHIHSGNTITVTYNGSVGNAFYQIEPFWASDDVNVFYPRFEMDELTALYFLAPLTKKGKQYAYDCKWTKEKMEGDTILLPIDASGNIDFKFMRSRIRELEEERIRELEEERIRELEAYLKACGFENTDLTPPEIRQLQKLKANQIKYETYKIIDLFDVMNTHNILKTNVVFNSGPTPYVTAGEGNNSVVSYIEYDKDLIENGNAIMIGGKTMVITYQPFDFFSNDSHNLVLHLKSKTDVTENENLFFVTTLYKSLSHKYHWGDSISRAKIRNDEVKLPVTPDGNIDYASINLLINALKKRVISNVKDFIRKEHDAYQCVIDQQ